MHSRVCARLHGVRLLLVFLGAGLFPAAGAAQRGTLDRFVPGETPDDAFHLSRPSVPGHLKFGTQLHLSYANDPLVYERRLGDPDSEQAAVVSDQLVATLGLSLGLGERFVLFAGLPITAWMRSGDGSWPSTISGPTGAGMGDAALGARIVLLEGASGALALQVGATLPTSSVPSEAVYRGEMGPTLTPALLGELRLGQLRLALDLGVLLREDNIGMGGDNLAFRDELLGTFGIAYRLWQPERDPRTHLAMHLQMHGRSSLDAFGSRGETPLEALLGFRYAGADGMRLGIGGGMGLTRGFGSPDARLVALVGWRTPDPAPVFDRDGDGIEDEEDRCPAEPEDEDGFEDHDGCPDTDDDADGIVDAQDRCPRQPETRNGFEDGDGCPDEVPDTDGDGIKDDLDQCDEQPEDPDQFQDEDGCPDPDNDGDGVLDGADRCPNEAGPVENRGCPDTDRDGDSVVDRLDNCPDEPGDPANHGCKKKQKVVIRRDRLEILDKVYFKTNSDRIRRRSYALLMNVAAVLNAHPEIDRVRIEGHTDSRGQRDYNLQLSQRRAESVLRFLVERGGVDQSRLRAVGYGPDRPVVPNARTRQDHARNRRVEFVIVMPEGAPAPAQQSGEGTHREETSHPASTPEAEGDASTTQREEEAR